MSKTKAFAILALTAIVFGGVTYAWMGPQYLMDEEKSEWQAMQEQIRQAVGNSDYETWRALMTEKFNAIATKERFSQIQEMHWERAEIRNQMQSAMEKGNYELARELRMQAGMNRRKGMRNSFVNCPMQK